MAKNLLNDIVEQNRDGGEVMEAVMIYKTEPPTSNFRFLSVLHQQSFLKKIVRIFFFPLCLFLFFFPLYFLFFFFFFFLPF